MPSSTESVRHSWHSGYPARASCQTRGKQLPETLDIEPRAVSDHSEWWYGTELKVELPQAVYHLPVVVCESTWHLALSEKAGNFPRPRLWSVQKAFAIYIQVTDRRLVQRSFHHFTFLPLKTGMQHSGSIITQPGRQSEYHPRLRTGCHLKHIIDVGSIVLTT